MRNYPGLSDEQRKQVADGLARVLADTYTLYFKTHAFHWNVEGPEFYRLHNMFEEQYREMWEATDTIAERIRALGHPAPGSYAELGKLTSIPEQDGKPKPADMTGELLRGHEQVIVTLRNTLETAQGAGDEGTVNLLGDRIEQHEKTAWMLSTTLEAA